MMTPQCYSSAVGDGVAAFAAAMGDDRAWFWMVDANERDARGGHVACRFVRDFMLSSTSRMDNVAQVVTEADKRILPAAAVSSGIAGLATSLVVGLVYRGAVELAFAGEIRSHVLGPDGRILLRTRDHTLYGLYDESVWRGQLGLSETEAKLCVTNVVGGGTVEVEVHRLPATDHGAVVTVSHLWHRYQEVDAYISRLHAIYSHPDREKLQEGEAAVVVRW